MSKMRRIYKSNSIVIGFLFIITLFVGMIDVYFVAPELNTPLSEIYQMKNTLLLGVFSIFAMGVGVVGISIAFFPVIKRQSEAMVFVYIFFRFIACLLLVFIFVAYLFLINTSNIFPDTEMSQALSNIVITMKSQIYQLVLLALSLGNFFLCYSLFKSKVIPRFITVWGFVGYVFLFFSALLDILGYVDTINGIGALMYAPGGLWEMLILPFWLLTKGFRTEQN